MKVEISVPELVEVFKEIQKQCQIRIKSAPVLETALADRTGQQSFPATVKAPTRWVRKSVIKSESKPVLDQVLDLLRTEPARGAGSGIVTS